MFKPQRVILYEHTPEKKLKEIHIIDLMPPLFTQLTSKVEGLSTCRVRLRENQQRKEEAQILSFLIIKRIFIIFRKAEENPEGAE